MKTRFDLTIAIPTYNGAARLPLVLEQLRLQHAFPYTWEIVVVDNNSTDSTRSLVAHYQAHWRQDVPLRYSFEPRQGLAFARQHAVEAAQGEWIGFLDDDNLPAPTWIQAAMTFCHEHPQLGAVGSEIKGCFEAPPPEALRPLLHYLALVNRGSTPMPYCPHRHGLPPGAGLVVRRRAWLESVPPQLLLMGRVGRSMVCGEDTEALTHLYRRGWQIWHNPAMLLTHLISAHRVQPDYFRNLMRGIGLSRHHLRMLLLPAWQRFPAFWLYLISDCLRLVAHLIHSRDRLSTDGLAQCEAERRWATLISPFYIWKRQLYHLCLRFPSLFPFTTGHRPLPKASNPS